MVRLPQAETEAVFRKRLCCLLGEQWGELYVRSARLYRSYSHLEGSRSCSDVQCNLSSVFSLMDGKSCPGTGLGKGWEAGDSCGTVQGESACFLLDKW